MKVSVSGGCDKLLVKNTWLIAPSVTFPGFLFARPPGVNNNTTSAYLPLSPDMTIRSQDRSRNRRGLPSYIMGVEIQHKVVHCPHRDDTRGPTGRNQFLRCLHVVTIHIRIVHVQLQISCEHIKSRSLGTKEGERRDKGEDLLPGKLHENAARRKT